MKRRLAVISAAAFTFASGVSTGMADDDPSPEGSWDGYVNDKGVVVTGSLNTKGELDTPDGDPGGDPSLDYRWLPACSKAGPTAPIVDCVGALRCPNPDEKLWTLWGKTPMADGWVALRAECRGDVPPGAPRPTLTPGDVLEATRRIDLPSLQVHVQPEDETLVNFATIFYAEPETFERTVTILGFSVDVRAEPSSYRWVFGDGHVATTEGPGAPYPAKDITHKYGDAHVTVHPRVDVTYEVQYRVDGGEWQSLEETLTAQGPATSLRIREATPVLSGGD
jgi:hypothetical protein